MSRKAIGEPTSKQVRTIQAVVLWYLRTYHGSKDDPGVRSMFSDRRKVGAFAVTGEELERGDANALFRLFVATTMFQRLRDVQILRILCEMSQSDADDLTRPRRLLKLVDQSECPHMRGTAALHSVCDLGKHAVTRQAECSANPAVECHLKRHTILLRRYGHFGKVPTSAALMLREAGAKSLQGLRAKVLHNASDPQERARSIQETISRTWRVSDKIASMFMSTLCVPDLSPGTPPWRDGVDWTRFVVVDSNVDLFLRAIAYRGRRSYGARSEFIRSAAKQIDLAKLRRGLTPFNPRLVQQAMYIFMSTANRKTVSTDCMRHGPATCARCPTALARICPVRSRDADNIKGHRKRKAATDL